MRKPNLAALLRAAGVSRAESAQAWLSAPEWESLRECEGFWKDLAALADPEQALLGLVNLVERGSLSLLPDYLARVASDRRRG